MKRVGYTRTQVRLHWAVAGLVLLQLLFHEPMAQAWDVAVDSGVFALSRPVLFHFIGGATILGLMFWRVALRQEHGVPPPDAQEDRRLTRIARGVHLGFYGVLVALPITGGLAWGTQSEALSRTHEVLRAVLVLGILAHVSGALYHRFVLKSEVLARMVTPRD